VAGKFIVALMAAAVSSASAATVGVVFTHAVHPRHDAPAPVAAAAAGSVKSAVVLNASESLFAPVSTDAAPESDASAACSGDQHCSGAAPHGSDVRLNILGATPSILPNWFGGDSEDDYAGRSNTNLWTPYATAEPIEFSHIGHRRLGRVLSGLDAVSDAGEDAHSAPQSSDSSTPASSDGNNNSPDSQNQDASHTDADSTSSITTTFTIATLAVPFVTASPSSPDSQSQDGTWPDFWRTFTPPQPPAIETPDVSPQLYVAPPAVTPPVTSWAPSIGSNGRSSITAPEPSTWAMMIIGAVAVCVFKRRRIVAALKSVRA
jgi:hypothetical protein